MSMYKKRKNPNFSKSGSLLWTEEGLEQRFTGLLERMGLNPLLMVQDGFNQLFNMSKETDSCKLSSKVLVQFLKCNTLHMESEKHPSVPTSLYAKLSCFSHFNAELNALSNSIRLEILQ